MIRALICDPISSVGEVLQSELETLPAIVTVQSGNQGAKYLTEKQAPQLVFQFGQEGNLLESLRRLRETFPESMIIAVDDSRETQSIVSALKNGASDYWHSEEVDQKIPKLIAFVQQKLTPPQDGNHLSQTYPEIIGRHSKILKIFKLLERVSKTDSSILISGPSGTGKELIAQAIHSQGPRKNLPWVAINCAAIPANLIESELFGHVKGAFTGAVQNRMGRFQMAGKGTLFLDEIGELNFDLQAKLLRSLQTKQFEPVGSTQTIKFEARVIAATNQNLEQMVREKKFREDLFYRLSVIPIEVPSLRNRTSDIPLLAHFFIKKFSKQNNQAFPGISPDAMKCLMQYHWPGNIRELENLIERVIVLKEGDRPIEISDFPEGYFKNIRLDKFLSSVTVPDDGLDFNLAVDDFENELIVQALQKTSGNKNKAAHLLRLNRTTLVEKLKRKGLKIIA